MLFDFLSFLFVSFVFLFAHFHNLMLNSSFRKLG
jgi:hypothetical protein